MARSAGPLRFLSTVAYKGLPLRRGWKIGQCPQARHLHALSDGLGRALTFVLTPGQAADCRAGEILLQDLPTKCRDHGEPGPRSTGHKCLFASSDRGEERAAAMFPSIETAKLNNLDPQAWLADVLCRINDHPAAKLDQLLLRHWKKSQAHPVAA
jgi:IS66 C-terminal element